MLKGWFMRVIKRGLEVLREEGVRALIKKASVRFMNFIKEPLLYCSSLGYILALFSRRNSEILS
jgi:hypothetical protein